VSVAAMWFLSAIATSSSRYAGMLSRRFLISLAAEMELRHERENDAAARAVVLLREARELLPHRVELRLVALVHVGEVRDPAS
jgi:hypothetical protein